MLYKDADLELHHTLTDTPSDTNFTLHAHNRFEIYCFLNGQGYYTVEGHDYPLTPGCILIMRDGEAHTLHVSPEKPYERIALHFAPSLVEDSRKGELLSVFRGRPLGQGNRLPPCPALDHAKDMLLRITDPDVPLSSCRERILAYLPALLFELSLAARSPAPSEETDAPTPLVGQIIDYINESPAAVTGMEAMEERFGYSRSYLNRVFRQSTGVSIWDYVILKRLTAARKAIQGGTPAAIAAKEAGYTDYSSFYRQYKKRFGVTPEEEKRLKSISKKS